MVKHRCATRTPCAWCNLDKRVLPVARAPQGQPVDVQVPVVRVPQGQVVRVPQGQVVRVPLVPVVRVPLGQVVRAPPGQVVRARLEQVVKGPLGQVVRAPPGQVVRVPLGQVVRVPLGQVAKGPLGQVAKAPLEQVAKAPLEQVAKAHLEQVAKAHLEQVAKAHLEQVAKAHLEQVAKGNAQWALNKGAVAPAVTRNRRRPARRRTACAQHSSLEVADAFGAAPKRHHPPHRATLRYREFACGRRLASERRDTVRQLLEASRCQVPLATQVHRTPQPQTTFEQRSMPNGCTKLRKR
jgi:hypothetical protein